MQAHLRRVVHSHRLQRSATRVRRCMRFVIAHRATAGLLVLIALVPPAAMGSWVDRTTQDWGVKDWVALASALWASFWFFVLAVAIGVDSQRRARASANAEIARTVGALAVAGSRSFAGADSQALRIPNDALAALQHYEAAGADQRSALLGAIQTAFADVVFGTACRADALPRSIWDRLCAGTGQLNAKLTALIDAEPDGQRREEFSRTRALVILCYRLGTALRRENWSLEPGDRIGLTHVLQPPRSAERSKGEEDGCFEVRYALSVLERLYADELTVIKKWEVLRECIESAGRPTPAVTVTVSLEDVHRARSPRLTPWYLSRKVDDDSSELRAVNVNDQELTEAAGNDRLRWDPELPVWPRPLTHGEVPPEMRRGGARRARDLLAEQPEPITVCALVYELVCPDGERRRLVVDGNHRLAGALRLAEERNGDTGSGDRPHHRCPVRVLAFTVSEVVTSEAEPPFLRTAEDKKRRRDGSEETWTWQGFTPDVQNLRSSQGDRIDEDEHARLRSRQEVEPRKE